MASDSVRRDGSRFGRRLIRDGGRVRWLGRWFKIADGTLTREEYAALPDRERAWRASGTPKYDGCMDGKYGIFYDYGPKCPEINGINLHHVEGEDWPGSTCVEGVFCWDDFDPEPAHLAEPTK